MAPSNYNQHQWSVNYHRLSEFYKEHKHTNLPFRDPEYRVLAKWASSQRNRHEKGRLSKEEKDLLDELNFQWNRPDKEAKYDALWVEKYQQLKLYKLKNGDTNVPQQYTEENSKLGSWVANQRRLNGKGKLKQIRIELLDAIGFQWSVKDTVAMRTEKASTFQFDKKWQAMFDKLLDFKSEHGHVNVPYTYKQDPSLAMWVASQRRVYKKKAWDDQLEMRQDRIDMLNKIGFQWELQSRGGSGENEGAKDAKKPSRKRKKSDSDQVAKKEKKAL